MKHILILIILLPLLLSVTQVRATEIQQGDITVIETVTTDMPLMGLVAPDALCKSQAHKVSFRQGGIEKAWTKVTMTQACWTALLSLQNSTRSHWAATGWKWTWGHYLLGGRTAKINPIYRWTYDWLDMPGVTGYIVYHGAYLAVNDPMDMNWYSQIEPYVEGGP